MHLILLVSCGCYMFRRITRHHQGALHQDSKHDKTQSTTIAVLLVLHYHLLCSTITYCVALLLIVLHCHLRCTITCVALSLTVVHYHLCCTITVPNFDHILVRISLTMTCNTPKHVR